MKTRTLLISLFLIIVSINLNAQCNEKAGYKKRYFYTSEPSKPLVGISGLTIKIILPNGKIYYKLDTEKDGGICIPFNFKEAENCIVECNYLKDQPIVDRFMLTSLFNVSNRYIPKVNLPLFETPARGNGNIEQSKGEIAIQIIQQQNGNINEIKRRDIIIDKLKRELNTERAKSQKNEYLIDSLGTSITVSENLLLLLKEDNIELTKRIEWLQNEVESEKINAAGWVKVVKERIPKIKKFDWVPTKPNINNTKGKKCTSIYEWRYIEIEFQTENLQDKKLPQDAHVSYIMKIYIESAVGQKIHLKKEPGYIIDSSIGYLNSKIAISIDDFTLSTELINALATVELYCVITNPNNENLKIQAQIAKCSYKIRDSNFDFSSRSDDLTVRFNNY